MKKVLLITIVSACLCQGIVAQNNVKIDTDLQQEMTFRKASELIRINIILKHQYDQKEMHMKSSVFPKKEDKRTFVVDELKRLDDNGHGTHCAGTAAGDGTAGSQTGMAPDAKIMAIKIWSSIGSGTVSNCCDGFQFAVDYGAHVINLSGGWVNAANADKILLRNTVVSVLEAGIVAAVAAGNEGASSVLPNSVRTPGNCPPPWLHPDQTTTGGLSAVVSVGSTDINDNIAGSSSRGPVTWQSISGYNDYPYNPGMGLIRPDVCAPGVNIKSCSHTDNSGYTFMSGTSMATPCVAGVMALMLSKNINLTSAGASLQLVPHKIDVKQII